MKHIILFILLFLTFDAFSQVVITKTDVKCRGNDDGTLRVTLENGAEPVKSYQWNDGVNAQERINVKAGSYCVTVTDANDCTATNCAVVTEPETALRLVLEFQPYGQNVLCGDPQPVYLVAYAYGGTSPYRINGKPGVSEAFLISATQIFKVVLTDKAGCLIERDQEVHILPKVCSNDPNEITGPSGIDSVQWISVRDTLDYQVKFENDPVFATAPAQRVIITHHFDDDINPYSLRLGNFGFGNYNFEVPDNVAFFQKRYDLRNDIGVYLDVVAGLNVANQTAFWTFETIDPLTGLLPIDPLVGFLPVNDTISRSGEGFLNFSVQPKLPGTTGDTVHAQASIIFDINEPIVTNTWTNLIDAIAPTTQLEPVDSIRHSKLIELSVSGADDVNGSGLSHYELWVSQNGGAYQKHEQTIPDSLQTFLYEGEYATTYEFYILGVDRTGNREIKQDSEAYTEVLPRQELNLVRPLADEYCAGDTLWMEWETVSIDSVNVYLSLDSGMTYILLGGPFGADDTTTYYFLEDSLINKYIKVEYRAHLDTFETFSSILPIKGYPVVSAGMDKSICRGGYTHLLPEGANIYRWFPDEKINNPLLTIPTVFPDSTMTYYVTGTDSYGCRNTDSMIVTVHGIYQDTFIHLMCNQDSVFVGGGYQTEPGLYLDELASEFGCDSNVVTEVILTGPCIFPSPQIYVDKDATGLNNGTSWSNAFVELKDALDAAKQYAGNDEIWIAEGVYKPHTSRRDTSFILHDSIKIYGGFMGIEMTREERTSNAELVKLSGDINIPDTLWDNSYHTVQFSDLCAECVIDGVTITYGHADQAINAQDVGAGVLNKGRGRFFNVIFERNFATQMGSALHSSGNTANLIIENCTFRLNTSSLGRDVVNISGAQVEFRGANGIR